MINDLQEYVESNPDEVTVFLTKYSGVYDFFVFIKKMDLEIEYPLYENEIYIEVECWKGGDSVRRMAYIKKSQFDIWLRDKKINDIVDEVA
jgi:hypothetical protein